MEESITANSDPQSALRLATAACVGVAALAKWVAANSTNSSAALDVHRLMRDHIPYEAGTDREKTFEFILLRSLFGPENTPTAPSPTE